MFSVRREIIPDETVRHVGLYWRAFGLQPHRTETFKLSPGRLLIEKVSDIAMRHFGGSGIPPRPKAFGLSERGLDSPSMEPST